MIKDAGIYNECATGKIQLIEVVRYRESVCDKFEADITKEGTGFKWPWQK